MFCDKCGNQLNENEKVCPNCGNAIEEVQPNVGFTGEQPQNTAFTPQQFQGMPYAQPTQPPKKRVDILKLLPIISNAIGVVSGILSIIFGIKIKNYNNTYLAGYVSSFNYGGAAYTGIQNAAADTGNNVKAVYQLIQNSAMFLLITIGLIAISAFFSKLIKAVMDFKSSE